MTYYAHDGSSRGWISTGLKHADEFKSLGGDLEGMSVGANYGDGLYQVVTMNADQAGWGSAVPKGYEKVAYMDTDSERDDITPGKALLRKIGGSLAKPEPEAPAEKPKPELNTTAIAAAREKAEAVRRTPIPEPTPVKLGAGELYDNIYNLGTKGLQDYERSMQERRARNIEANAETITGINYALKLLDPDIQPTKPTDPWAIYERLKGDILA